MLTTRVKKDCTTGDLFTPRYWVRRKEEHTQTERKEGEWLMSKLFLRRQQWDFTTRDESRLFPLFLIHEHVYVCHVIYDRTGLCRVSDLKPIGILLRCIKTGVLTSLMRFSVNHQFLNWKQDLLLLQDLFITINMHLSSYWW